MKIPGNALIEQSTGKAGGAPRIDWQVGVIALFAVALFLPSVGQALTARYNPNDFRDEDAKSLEAIAAYPPSAHHAALVVAGYPEELLETQKIQQKSADDFSALLGSYPRKTQEKIWNLVRYRGLTRELGRGGRKTKVQLQRIAENYPIEDRPAIVEEGRKRYSLWVQIYALDLEVEQTFFALLSPLPKDVQDAFNDLTKHPELTSVLIDNMRFTTVLGAAYRDDPTGVEKHLSTLHDEVLARRSAEERAWAEEVADPEAAEELEYAARTFAEEYDYDIGAVESTWGTNVYITHHVDAHPYPFWFGYPYWYDFAYWYPRPIWGHLGFHFGYGHGYVSIGLPSLFFLDWYHGYYATSHHVVHRDHHHRSTYRQVHYYEKHRPHYSAGHQRHHDSRVKRAHLDPRRQHHVENRRVSTERRRQIDSGDRRAATDLHRRDDMRRRSASPERRQRQDSRSTRKSATKHRSEDEVKADSAKPRQRGEQTGSEGKTKARTKNVTTHKKTVAKEKPSSRPQKARVAKNDPNPAKSKARSSGLVRRDGGHSNARSAGNALRHRQARSPSRQRSGSGNRGQGRQKSGRL